MWKKACLLFLFCFSTVVVVFSQSERKYIRRGNDEYKEKKYVNSEIAYRKAIGEGKETFEALFNVGDALYKQEKYEEAAKQFSELANQDLNKDKLAKVYHNLGNSLLNSDKFKESIEAYKRALKHDPDDVETKHNLTYALNKLEEQENQQQDQKDQQQDQDQEDQENNEDQQDEQDQQDQQDQQQQDQNEQQEEEEQEENQQQQSSEPEISKEDAERLLQALENDEKLLQEKLKKKIEESEKKAKTTKEW
ncbi:MAG: tetratricopeptide repeat protein [Bacteroidales bacterium]